MNYRAGNVSDAAELAALVLSHRALLTIDPDGRGADQFIESVSETAIRGYLESARYWFTVAESNGRVLGFIAIRDESHLFHLFVSAEHQGQGIGRSLWQRGLTAASKGSRNATFTVNSSPNAVPVYRRFGFVETGPLVHMHGVSFLPMRRSPTESDV